MEILIVDDDKSITKVLSTFLGKKGHSCSVSNDGEEGVLLCLKKKFDAIILDLMMPSFTGVDFIESLKKKGKLGEQKIIVLTALDNQYEPPMKNNTDGGIMASFQKPVDLSKLLMAVEA